MPRIHDAPVAAFSRRFDSIALVLATQAHGSCLIHEWMYESRLYWVDRLISMGARVIVCDPHRASLRGRPSCTARPSQPGYPCRYGIAPCRARG